MATEKCDYCGKEFDTKLFSSLDNGSRACIYCVNAEEKSEKSEERKER